MRRRNQLLPWVAGLGVPALLLLAQSAPDSVYHPGGMQPPYGALSPELARTVAEADRGNPPSRFGRLMSRQWAYGAVWERENLRPVPNPHPAPELQPRRDHPFDVAVNGAGTKCYVSLTGSEMRPGSEVAVYDVSAGRLVKRILLKPPGAPGEPGLSPMRLQLHPRARDHREQRLARREPCAPDPVVRPRGRR